ncbi:MAG: 16S rRNA (cytosine(967)-C(5))-methyltransferase RsmB [Eubacteriales bacterium]
MKDRSRKAAFDAFNDIIKNKSYGNLVLKNSFNNLNPQEKRFASRLVYGTLEKMITIDWIIDNYVKKHAQATMKNILRLGVYQIYYMNSVPLHAACSTSVELAKYAGKGGASGFINGVLRNVARDKENLKLPDDDLSIKYSCPKWIVDMWIKDLGKEQTVALLSYEDDKGIVIRANSLKDYSSEKLETELKKRDIAYEKGKIISDAYRVDAGFEDIDIGLFDEGKIAVQDEGSMVIAKMAVEDKPEFVLDACAAPGGKTAAMASIYREGKYIATDIHPHRVEIMEKMFERLGVEAKTYRFDAAEKPFEIEVDCLLVDAPCSGLGTMFKQPDIKYNKTYEDIKELAKTQLRILNNCAKSVSAGGHLIYSTCTISKRENQDVVEKFLKENADFEIIEPKGNDILKNAFDGTGVQLMPNIHGTSGFYIAKMKRKIV